MKRSILSDSHRFILNFNSLLEILQSKMQYLNEFFCVWLKYLVEQRRMNIAHIYMAFVLYLKWNKYILLEENCEKPVWIRLCWVKGLCSAKLNKHMSHLYGFSPIDLYAFYIYTQLYCKINFGLFDHYF